MLHTSDTERHLTLNQLRRYLNQYLHWCPGHPLAERGPSLESIHRVSLTVDLCEGNKIISLKNLFHHSQLGPLKKKIKSGAQGTCPVCPLVKTALILSYTIAEAHGGPVGGSAP